MTLRVVAEAEAESFAAAAWYDAQRQGLGTEFLDELSTAFDAIEQNPQRYPEIPSEGRRQLRKRVLARFPYQVIYQPVGDDVWVLAVAHGRRRPNYWKRRAR
ncbi:MAG TPA: type II toxin-antitoxin system RelE/ParE family toxin [Tepidisphaeraceae bacterium]